MTKGFCLTVLLCAFVQVQCLTPYVFSTRSHYGLFSSSSNVLDNSEIVVQFDEGIAMRDCATGRKCIEISSTDGSVEVTTGVVTVSTNARTATFTPQVYVSPFYAGEVDITFTVPAGAFNTESGKSCTESAPYTVHAGGKLESTVSFETISASSTVKAKISYNRQTYSVADGHEAEQPFEIATKVVGGTATTNVRDFRYAHFDNHWIYFASAESDSIACINAANDEDILRDVYGNTVKGVDFAGECTTVKYFCGEYGEWSQCRYTCTPEEHDLQYNTQFRTRGNINGGTCAEETREERQCETKDVKCIIQIKAGETGSECDAGCNIGVTPSGCKCSDDCVENGDCCQSYFKSVNNCVSDSSNPDYAYLYSECWANSLEQCGTDLDCKTGFVNKDGECPIANSDPPQTRKYKHSCFCFLDSSNIACNDFQGKDWCCGGGQAYSDECLLL